MTSKLFCFGLGYCAQGLAQGLLNQGWQVTGTSRDPNKAPALQAQGLRVLPFDGQRPLEAGWLEGVTHLLISIPPGENDDGALALHRSHLTQNNALRWIGYLSTTGVYGDSEGAWVDETSPLNPSHPRGARRVKAEAAWLKLGRDAGIPTQVFRLGGIYGPGRSPLDRIKGGRGQRISKPGQVFNRSHRDDIVQALKASIERPTPGLAFNIVDDEPAPNDEVLALAYELLDLPVPPAVPFEKAQLSPMGRSFYEDNRRVSNQRMKDVLAITLKYPTYREGLKGLI